MRPLVAMTMKTKTCKPSSCLSRSGRRCQQSSFVGRCSENWRASFGLACRAAVQRLQRCLRVHYKNCLYRCRMMQVMACSSRKAEHAAWMVGCPPEGLHEFHFELENWHGLWIKTGKADPLSTTPPPQCHRSWGSRKIPCHKVYSCGLGEKKNGSFFFLRKTYFGGENLFFIGFQQWKTTL